MAKITYPQQLPEDANSIKHVSIGQTRDGKDEWITPVTMWERNKSSGHISAGVLSDDDVANQDKTNICFIQGVGLSSQPPPGNTPLFNILTNLINR